ncbi:MAG: hypothetical protein IKT46_08985 [Clostridia bacterium]|nr:hypothetical protein [Clostridia bacterium]
MKNQKNRSIIKVVKEGDITDNNIVGAVIAFALGAVVAYINYAVSKYLLKTRPDMYSGGQIVRSVIQIGYIVLVYTLGGYTPWNPIWLTVGGCLGITVPMFYFTYRLVRYNDNKKEDEKDGSQL